MARVPEHPGAASLGQKTMTRTIHCPECGVTLNVPESAAGRKLKCPKCATKFAAPSGLSSPADSGLPRSRPESTLFPTRKGPSSSQGSHDLPTLSAGDLIDDFDLPSSPASLRDTFDLPLLAEASPKAGPGPAKVPAAADALALFQDEPKSNRKLTGAEARAKARRCPSCGGVVGVGMSLCNSCGLDLDTGRRVVPVEVFEDEMPTPYRSETPSIGVMFVGGISAVISLLLAVISLVAWSKGAGSGVLCLMIVWIFGIWASVQFLRRKAMRPLFLAHALGVGIGVVYLIALPIWVVNFGTDELPSEPVIASVPADADSPPVKNLAEDLDVNKITWGIAVMLSYAVLSVYLNTPGIKREFPKR